MVYSARGWTRVGIGDCPIDVSLAIGGHIYSWQEPTREEALEDHVKRYLL